VDQMIVSGLIPVVGWLKKWLKPVQRFRENLLLYTGQHPFSILFLLYLDDTSPRHTVCGLEGRGDQALYGFEGS